MDYKEIKLYDFELIKNDLNCPADKVEAVKEIWQEDDRQFINWIVSLLI